jgi:hypothetical protein
LDRLVRRDGAAFLDLDDSDFAIVDLRRSPSSNRKK